MNHYFHADDIQMYMSLLSKESLREVATLFKIGVSAWMARSKQMLNPGFSLGPNFNEKNPYLISHAEF